MHGNAHAGLAKLAEKNPPPPLLKPVIVAAARSGPVGASGLPVVARIEAVIFGVVPVHEAQKRFRSTLVN